jgi:tetratricopeptide (TPR) repeat protein
MTESICLHIQDHESGPIRLVELPWTLVRIGRAAHCEVRLTSPDLPEEVCRLQRRGQSWRLFAGTADSPIFLEGRRVGGACGLPFDVPFRTGRYCFTLRRDRAAEPDWELYAGPAPAQVDRSEKPPVAEAEPDPLPEPPKAPAPAAPLRLKAKPLMTDERPEPKLWDSKASASREQWETRWKALGAQVKARAESNRINSEVNPPTYQSDLEPIPLRELRVPLVQPLSRSLLYPGFTPALSPGSAKTKIEPLRPRATAESHWRNPKAEVAVGPKAAQQFPREPIAREAPAPIPSRGEKGIDLEQKLAEVPQELPVENTPVTTAGTDELAAGTDDPLARLHEEPLPFAPDFVLPVSLVEDVRSELQPFAIDHISSPVVEPQTPINGPDDTRLVSGDELVSSLPYSAVVPDDPRFEPRRAQLSPSPAKEVEWPSAKDILATYRSGSCNRVPMIGSKKTTKKMNRSSLLPTLARTPSQWNPPVVLAGSASAVFILFVGLLGCTLSWSWASDSYTASIVTDRLLASDQAAQGIALSDSTQPPEKGWLVSTSAHMTNWAILLSRSSSADNQSSAKATALLERSLVASPVNAQARLASAQLQPADSSKSLLLRNIGLSRDAASLAWSARCLLAAGKKEDALKLYGCAISVAIPDKPPRSRVPRFSEDSGVRRYLLPGEEQVRDIICELVSQNVWTFDEWSRALPETPIVLIATARLLREQGRAEAETLLDLILKERVIPLASGAEVGSVTLAARAEAFALQSRFKEADQLYRLAIDSIDDPTIQRSWWFNLADVAYRSNNDTERQAALRNASSVAFSDDITLRATEIQRATLARSTGVKAN